MKKKLILCLFALQALTMSAQNFGGFQMPEIKMEYSEKIADVNYVGDGESYHTLDIYLPKNKAKRYPVVIHIYGSAWFSNSSKGMADLGTICQALLDAGYAVVTPNHRSSMDAKFPAQINDIKAVVRFVRGNAKKYHFDKNFIAISGFSSGGHLATLIGASGNVKELEGDLGEFTKCSSKVNAVCDWSGPIDMFKMNCDEPRKWGNTPEEALVGHNYADEYAQLFRNISPITYLDKDDAPMIIFHGQEDNVVPCCQGKELFEELTKAGVKTDITIVPGGGHGFNMYSKENLKKMVGFFDSLRK
ncbi:MAG: alpha/beta hydrolase [Bacteroidaceae bacterium]|nr:alpha/beta hydrolase [Bacteroidaceae bacterium]